MSDKRERNLDAEALLAQMTPEEKAQMCSGRDFWKTQDIERLGIPSVMMCDGPNGLRKQEGVGDHLGINASIETVCYPTASAMAASFDRELLRRQGEMLGAECRAERVGMLLGPGINMKRSPLCGRNFEYYSEDPYLAGELAASYIRGLQSTGTAACVKHFAANNQETRRMSGSSEVDERTLHELYLPAFEAAVKEGGVKGIMCAYNALNGTFCSVNRELLTDVLREDWGFDGFVVTDWGAVKDRVQGLLAGLDLEMPGSTEGKTRRILEALESGELPESVLDEAVRNVLKFVASASEAGLAADAGGPMDFDREQAHAFSGEAASQCAVLLKNETVGEQPALPLQSDEKVLFIGAFAAKPRYQGAGSSHINVSHPVSALECTDGLPVTFAQGYDPAGESDEAVLRGEAVRAAREADTAVIFAGLPEAYESEGVDRAGLDLPESQNRLIREVSQACRKTIVVLHGGSPMALPWKEEVSAILTMYLGGDQVGRAAVDLLYGRVNPSGHLAETWPLKLSDNPSYLNFPGEGGVVEYREGIYIGYRYYDKKEMDVLFPFGHGLSYTSYAYSDLAFDQGQMTDGGTVTVTCRVKNTGTREGREVVQLYTGRKQSDVRRPVRELKGFEKISLAPGEEKTVSFVLDTRSFAYYEPRIHDWFLESGEAVVEIGSSSRDIRLSGSLPIVSGRELPMTITRQTALGDLMKTAKGREFFTSFTKRLGMDSNPQASEAAEAMGEGSAAIMVQMMFETPLGSLVSYGVMSEEALDQLIAELNA